MSVNIGEAGEEAMIFYRDPMELMAHLADKHGTDAVTRHGRDSLRGRRGTGTARWAESRCGYHPRRSMRCMPAPQTNPSCRAIHKNTVRLGQWVRHERLPARQGTDTPSCAGMLAFPVRNHVHPWIQRRVSGARRPRLNLFLKKKDPQVVGRSGKLSL